MSEPRVPESLLAEECEVADAYVRNAMSTIPPMQQRLALDLRDCRAQLTAVEARVRELEAVLNGEQTQVAEHLIVNAAAAEKRAAEAEAKCERLRAALDGERERCAAVADAREATHEIPVWGEPDPEHATARNHECQSIAAAIRALERP